MSYGFIHPVAENVECIHKIGERLHKNHICAQPENGWFMVNPNIHTCYQLRGVFLCVRSSQTYKYGSFPPIRRII